MALEVYAVYGHYGKNGEEDIAYTEGEIFEIEGIRYGVSNYEPIGNDEVVLRPYYAVTELSTGLRVTTGPSEIAARSNAKALHPKVKKILGKT